MVLFTSVSSPRSICTRLADISAGCVEPFREGEATCLDPAQSHHRHLGDSLNQLRGVSSPVEVCRLDDLFAQLFDDLLFPLCVLAVGSVAHVATAVFAPLAHVCLLVVVMGEVAELKSVDGSVGTRYFPCHAGISPAKRRFPEENK